MISPHRLQEIHECVAAGLREQFNAPAEEPAAKADKPKAKLPSHRLFDTGIGSRRHKDRA